MAKAITTFIYNDYGLMYPATTASKIAGSRLATRTFFPHIKFRPTQKIRIEPIKDRLYFKFSLKKLSSLSNGMRSTRS